MRENVIICSGWQGIKRGRRRQCGFFSLGEGLIRDCSSKFDGVWGGGRIGWDGIGWNSGVSPDATNGMGDRWGCG